jgi:hypothetical protein
LNKKIELQLKITEAHLQFHKNEEMFLELVKKLIEQQTQLIGNNISEKNLNQILNNFNNTMGLLERNQVMYNKSHDRFLKMNLDNDENDEYYPQKLLSEAKDDNSKMIEEKNIILKENNEELRSDKELEDNKELENDRESENDKKIETDKNLENNENLENINKYKNYEFDRIKNENIEIKDDNNYKDLKSKSKENELVHEKEKKPKINLNDENSEVKDNFEEKMRNRLQKKIDKMKNEAIKEEKQNFDDKKINFEISDNVINNNNDYEYQMNEFELEGSFEQGDESVEYDKENLISIIISTVVEMTGYPESIISEEMDLKSDLGFDSIKINELLILLENKSIVINQKEIALLGINIKTITDLAEAVIFVSKKKLNL